MSDIVERRMDAYYYAFDATGVDAIDKILSAVACAGKAYHHTDSWNDEAGPYGDHKGNTPVEWMQNAANEAAAEITAARARIAELEGALVEIADFSTDADISNEECMREIARAILKGN